MVQGTQPQAPCTPGFRPESSPVAASHLVSELGGGQMGHAPATQYLFGDVAVLVNVIEVKGPLELLLDCSSQEDRKANHKVLGGKKGEE